MADADTTRPETRRASADDAQLYLHPQTLARVASLELRAKMIVEGVTSGMHRSPYEGFSVEFAQHRPYTPGDDLRRLDWKVYGRTDKLQLKEFQQETNLDLVVLVDASASMAYGSRSFTEASGAGVAKGPSGRAEWTKFDHATATAAALAFMSLRLGDRVGVAVFDDEIRAMVKRSAQQGSWRQIVGALSGSTNERGTDIGRVIDQTIAKLNNRCLIALVSDLFIDPEDYRAALARLRHRRHDLIVLQVVDRRERDLELKQPAIFEGLEGEPNLRIDPRSIRPVYQQVFREHVETIARITRRFEFDHQLVDTHDWLGPPLAAFIARRTAQLKRVGLV